MKAGSVAEVLELYGRWGAHRYDEEITQLEHALQTAALAARAGAAAELVAAALLHDVGHLLHLRDGEGTVASSPMIADLGHDAIGARWLAGVFPPAVTAPIALHVRAKRYRCAIDPGYSGRLSQGSMRSLGFQGGPMSAEEAGAFEAVPWFDNALRLRGWDDCGKVDGLKVPPVAAYSEVLDQVSTSD